MTRITRIMIPLLAVSLFGAPDSADAKPPKSRTGIQRVLSGPSNATPASFGACLTRARVRFYLDSSDPDYARQAREWGTQAVDQFNPIDCGLELSDPGCRGSEDPLTATLPFDCRGAKLNTNPVCRATLEDDDTSAPGEVIVISRRGLRDKLRSLTGCQAPPDLPHPPVPELPVEKGRDEWAEERGERIFYPVCPGDGRPLPPRPLIPEKAEDYRGYVLEFTNTQRYHHGLAHLKPDETAALIAQQHAQAMADAQTLSHDLPGSTFEDRLKKAAELAPKGPCGRQIGAENIAMNHAGPTTAVQQWMDSPGHRRNILTPYFTHLGVGVARSSRDGSTYWVQVFCEDRKK